MKNLHLLVVDDEENVVKALHRQLRQKFTVHVATSAEAAHSILREHLIDVVLSDQRMPGTTGAEFLSQVRQDFPNAVRLMLTGYADINAVIAAVNDGGIERYIQKPWEANELEQIISESYEAQELKIENQRLASELKSALEAEKHYSQIQSNFVNLVSHEFRTPLAIIMTSSETLQSYRDRLRPEDIEKKFDIITDQIHHMTYLLDEVLAISEYKTSIKTFQPQAFDFCDHFRDCIESIKTSIPSERHIITISISECPSIFVGEAQIIKEIITELVTNAVKFSPNGGTILCKLTLKATEAEIMISDEGIGISESDRNRIFKPFVRGENVGTIQGLGLGLVMVRHAVNLHNGQISVEANHQGGTRVRVILQFLSDPINN